MEAQWASNELKGAEVPDARRRASLVAICEALAAQPELAFSAALGSALRQAAHRLFQAATLTASGLLRGHVQRTTTRLPAGEWVLVIQDTTELDFSSHRATTGLGPLRGGQTTRGFLAHSALAVSPEGVPWGVLHVEFWARDPETWGQKHTRRQRVTADKESQKWLTTLQQVEAVLPEGQPTLFVQDRESDVFAFLAAPRRPTTQLLVRAAQPRQVVVEQPELSAPAAASGSLLEVARSGKPCGQFTVPVAGKDGQPAREATVTVRVQPVRVQPPRHRLPGEPDQPLRLWVVQACEEAPPAGTEPVHWVLLTTLAVSDAETARQLVRYYALRWRIEQLHYVLKSGCRVEALQHDDGDTLQKAVALYYLVAWRLLWCLYQARITPEAPAEGCLEPEALMVLRATTGRTIRTAAEVLVGIACLVGYEPSRHARPPGVKRLWQGYRRLQDLTTGYQLHQQLRHSNPGHL